MGETVDGISLQEKKNVLKAELEQAPSGQARDEISLGVEHSGDVLKLGPQTSSGGHVWYVRGKKGGLRWHCGGGGRALNKGSGSKREDTVNRRTGQLGQREKRGQAGNGRKEAEELGQAWRWRG